MDNSVLTQLLLQAQVRETLSQADRDRVAAKASTFASRPAFGLSHLKRLWCTTRLPSFVSLAHETVNR